MATEAARKKNKNAETIKITGGPHKCRHTYASFFLQNRPDLFALGRVLGHSSARVTELYSHLLPDHLADVRAAIPTFEAAPTAAMK